MRFAYLADMQLGAYASFSGLTEDQVARYASEKDMRVAAVPAVEGFAWDANQYAEAVRAVNALRPDLVLIGGDMVNDPNSEDQYEEFMRITGGIDSDIPVRWVPGNHDVADDAEIPTPESIARYREAFGSDYYAFDQGSIRFVTVNTVVIDHPEGAPGEWEAQLAFLEAELAEASHRGLPTVLVGHHPLFTDHADEEDTYWNLPIARRRTVLELIHRHRVPMALAGHWHRNAIAFDGDFEMITTGPVGIPLGDDPSGFRTFEYRHGVFAHTYRRL